MSAIRKRPIALQPVTSRPQLSTANQWSQHHLLTLRKSIDDSSHSNIQVKQELKMQRQNSHQFLSQIRTSMLTTEQSGIDLILKYQEQKCKHEHLTHLVKHYQQQIELEKHEEHQKLLHNIQTNEYDQLNIELTQKHKLLETVTNKLNSFQSETMSSYELVKAERRQRTVFSNQFNKFENQMFCLEEQYKQFVIERILLEKNFEQYKADFIKLQNDTMKKLQAKDKRLSTNNQQRDSEIRDSRGQPLKTSCQQSRFQIKLPKQNPKILIFDQWEQPVSSRSRKDQGLDLGIQPSFMKSRSKLLKVEKNQTFSKQFMTELNQKKLTNLEYKKKIQEIVNDLGLSSLKDLKNITKITENGSFDEYAQEVDRLNEWKRQDIKSLQQTIGQWQAKINQLKTTIKTLPLKSKRTKSQTFVLNHLKSIKKLLKSTTNNVQEIQDEISGFNSSENLYELIKTLNIDPFNRQISQEPISSQIDPNLMSQIQQKLFAVMGSRKYPQIKAKQKTLNYRKSFLFESVFTHPPQKSQKESLIHTQRSICPLLSPPSNNRNSKRVKTSVCPSSDFQPIKKLSNLLRNQSRFKGPVDVASKEQLINQATEAFGKEGIFRQDKFYVNYS